MKKPYTKKEKRKAMSKAGENKTSAIYGETRQETIVLDGSPKALAKINRSWEEYAEDNKEAIQQHLDNVLLKPLRQIVKDFAEIHKLEKKH